jgi:transcriptional regulator with XRE-family HTH domain
MKSDKPITESLPAVLDERGWTGRELERQMKRKGHGLSSVSIVKLINGELPPTFNTMERLANTLNISPEFFAEYRLLKARDELDPQVTPFKTAMRNLERYRS